MAALLAIGCNAVARATTMHREGSGNVRFVDSAGRQIQGPVLGLNGLYPGMTPKRTVVTIQNHGSASAHFQVSLVERAGGSGPSLADALHLVVTSEASGAFLYRGPLSGLRFLGQALRAGQSQRVAVMMSWPSQGTMDERYVGASVSFSLVVQSWHA